MIRWSPSTVSGCARFLIAASITVTLPTKRNRGKVQTERKPALDFSPRLTLINHHETEVVMHGTIGEMNVLDTTGHSKITWNKNNSTDVEIARASFDALRAK